MGSLCGMGYLWDIPVADKITLYINCKYGSERYGIFCGISQWEGMGLEYGMGLEDLSSHIFL